MLTAPQLEAAIEAALAQKPDALVVDFTDVDFPASEAGGIADIVALYATLDEALGAQGA